ncbi:sialate O-acetylesterase [Tichowtungia aerotolerans]|uniref:Sialate O-acetylesterase domain-containing protein n=1 Tax=Tichowtungia aerotolerans TaxID=2697043 RepID=A0A6P1M4I3_9BACT|nr:sialate O-acetylesterase [Tichowtungia aerotolerans]QHI69709.1 hypothetical protein GT409_09675 [Tichowtungia aerotolerans]
MRSVLLFGFLLMAVSAGWSAPKFNPLFTDHMVLQRGKPVPVCGSADPGEKVTVTFAGQSKTAVADSSGQWRLLLDPLAANSQSDELAATSADGKQTCADVLVGDVWLCAGQSNMATLMKTYSTLSDETETMKNPQVRLFKTKQGGVGAPEPSKQVVIDPLFKSSWQICSPEYAANFSATAMFFARQLQPQLNVPIGLIYANRGGTAVHSWLPQDVLASRPEYELYRAKAFPDRKPSKNNPGAIRTPSHLYNGTIHPLAPFAIKGTIWYQGESNSSRSELYAMEMGDLIASWRKLWGDDFYFLFVQLAPYGGVQWDTSGEGWAWLRQAQTDCLEIPKTGMAVILDSGEFTDIHPQNKQPVGERLALLAEQIDHPQVVASGPMFDSVQFKKGKAIISFKKGTAGGLHTQRVAMNKGRKIEPGKDPKAFIAPADKLFGFEISGKDLNCVAADARIDGDQVIVSHPSISEPVAVRYGWANFPLANLYNGAGLPACPFQSGPFKRPEGPYNSEKPPVANLGDPVIAIPVTTVSDSQVSEVSVAGRKAMQCRLEDRSRGYFYYKIEDPAFTDGAQPGVIIRVTYLNRGNCMVNFQYDSNDLDGSPNPKLKGAFKSYGADFYTKESGTWTTRYFVVKDAKFSGRCHKADIRINFINPDVDPVVAEVAVYPLD